MSRVGIAVGVIVANDPSLYPYLRNDLATRPDSDDDLVALTNQADSVVDDSKRQPLFNASHDHVVGAKEAH